MKNPKVIFAVVAFLALIIFSAYKLSQKLSQSDSMIKKDEIPMEVEKMTDDKKAGSRYVQYGSSTLDNPSSNRLVLFFYASWCPSCKSADASFTQNAGKIPNDVTLIRVNYNDSATDKEEKDLAKKYGITYQHTFVQIDSVGNEITKWNGGQIDDLLSNIK